MGMVYRASPRAGMREWSGRCNVGDDSGAVSTLTHRIVSPLRHRRTYRIFECAMVAITGRRKCAVALYLRSVLLYRSSRAFTGAGIRCEPELWRAALHLGERVQL